MDGHLAQVLSITINCICVFDVCLLFGLIVDCDCNVTVYIFFSSM